MKKFNVGDKVRGLKGRYAITNERMLVGEVIDVDSWGDISVRIIDHENKDNIGFKFSDLQAKYFELVDPANQKIIIYRNGNKVVAKDVQTKQEGVAKCSPDDEFDFYLGATIALERLTDIASADGEPEKELLNCKFVVAWRDEYSHLTKGKIYTVVDGYFKTGDDIFPICDALHTFSELECYLNESDTSDTFHSKFGGVNQIVKIVE